MDKIPEKMTAIAIVEPGGPLVLKPERRDVPKPGNGEILIRVRAAGVNRPDVAQRKGTYPPPPGASDLPGLEAAGEVVAVGSGAKRWRIGDAVTALTPGGGYAEYVAVHESNALPVPHGFTFTEAAALPETFFTVWHNVFQRGGLQPGESLLVHGGSSGIGTTAIQLASSFGSTVFTTAGSADKCEACQKLGATRAINYREEDFVAVIKEATEGKGVNVILDMVGGDYVDRNYEAAAVDGRIVQIATLGGPKAPANFARLMVKRLTHTGSTLRPRDVAFKGQIAAELETKVWPLLAERRIAPVMDMIFPLKEAWRAHERMEEGDHIGKIVLDVAQPAKLDEATNLTDRLSPRLLAIVEALPLRSGIRVLEIGCGPGAAAREVARRIGSGHVLAIDRSRKAIEQAETACRDEIAAGTLSLRQVAAEDFELFPREEKFDLAFAVRVGAFDGRHPAAGEKALPRIAAALKPSGRLLIDGGDPLRELPLQG